MNPDTKPFYEAGRLSVERMALETTPAFVRHLTADEALEFVDNPRATMATLELWYSTFSEGERQLFEQEVLTHEFGVEFFWQNLWSIFRSGRTPAQWVGEIQKNDWHRARAKRRVKN